jgi:hypothetical protein
MPRSPGRDRPLEEHAPRRAARRRERDGNRRARQRVRSAMGMPAARAPIGANAPPLRADGAAPLPGHGPGPDPRSDISDEPAVTRAVAHITAEAQAQGAA